MQDFQSTPPPVAAAAPPAETSASIVDVTTQDFIEQVVDASNERLVLLDLWAPWCGPCKQLTPLLEKLTLRSDGAVRLAKMNIDEHPAVAQQLQVQSIPAVFAFKGGKPVDGFMGALAESDLKKFIDTHLDGALGPSPAEALSQTASEMLAAGQLEDARECYEAALEQEPDNHVAMAGLVQTLLAQGDAGDLDAVDAARAVLADAPQNNNPELAAARAALALYEKTAQRTAQDFGDDASDDESAIAALMAAIKADANDHEARFNLALAYHSIGDGAAAMDALLDSVALKRDWNEEAARKQLVEFFDAYGAIDERVIAARRRLSSLLFS